MSKRLLVTSTDLMMVQFLLPHIIHLSESGYEVEIACSEVGGRLDEVRAKLQGHVQAVHQVRLHRSPASPDNLNGYRDMKRVIAQGHYDLIWTNEPVMGVVTRLAARQARKAGTKVLYMTHGFHFYEGAPVVNWMIYYPIEKWMAPKADVIATINREDYARAKTMRVQKTAFLHGIGINTARLNAAGNRGDIRAELGLGKEDFLVLSVGELNPNKNQQVILRALAQVKDPQIHYLLCGKGDELEHLKQLTSELHLERQVHFLGYRKDVVDICSQADLFVMPSRREGLGLAALEAMYSGLPLITSNARGFRDFMEDGVTGYLCAPDDVEAFADRIRRMKADDAFRAAASAHNREVVAPYCIEHTKQEIEALLRSL